MVLLLVLAVSAALAGEALTPQRIAEAEWSRDLATLVAGPYNDEDLPQVARSLGRLRDPGALDRLSLLVGLSDADVREAALVALGVTPGGAAVVRGVVPSLDGGAARSSAWWALGRSGDASDVPLLTEALLAPWPEGAAAAEALGMLAGRGVDVGPALPTLLGRLGAPDPRTLSAVAWAVGQARPAALSTLQTERVVAAWARAPWPSIRADLLATRWLAAPPRARASMWLGWVQDGQREVRVAAIQAAPSTDEAWGALAALSQDSDPWVREAARRQTGLREGPAEDPAVAGVRSGQGTPDDLARAVELARTGETPRVRAVAASVILGERPDAATIDALVTADDPVVRELVAAHLANRPELVGRLWSLAAHSPEPGARVRALMSLRAQAEALSRAEPGAPEALASWAAQSTFAVRRAIDALLEALGAPALAVPRALPGPQGVPHDLAAIEQLATVLVQTTLGSFRVVLEPGDAPLAVSTFATLAEQGAYDDLGIHVSRPGDAWQSGDARGDGMGGGDLLLPDETDARPFVVGAVGLVGAGVDAVSSQWFVTVTPQPGMAGQATRLGVVTEGLDLVQRLGSDDRVLSMTVERLSAGRIGAR